MLTTLTLSGAKQLTVSDMRKVNGNMVQRITVKGASKKDRLQLTVIYEPEETAKKAKRRAG